MLQFNNNGNAQYRLIASGTAAVPVNIVGIGMSGTNGLSSMTGTDDFLTIGTNFFGRPIDLGTGSNDTVNLGIAGNFYTLTLAGVEVLNGAGGDENVTLTNLANGLSVDLGGGSDNLSLANGENTLTLAGVEQIFVAGSNNTLTLNNNVSDVGINLGSGTNTLNLLGTTNSLASVFGVQTINGTASDDSLTLQNGANNVTVDLGGGTNDTLTVNGFQANSLTVSGVETLNLEAGAYQLTANGVQALNGSGNDDTVSLLSTLDGTVVDLGAGTGDTLWLANGANTLSAINVENINGSDFGGSPSDDTLTLLNNQNGASINLGEGTNTLNLAEGANTLAAFYGTGTINGTDTGDDTLTIVNGAANVTVDLGNGTDTLILGATSSGVTVVDVENVIGSSGGDTIVISGSGSTTVTGGEGVDSITASAGADTFRFTSASQSSINGGSDQVSGFDASTDNFQFEGMNDFASAIVFVGEDAFTGGTSQARLSGSTLQIDVDGDGNMTSADVEIQLVALTGTLQSSNFDIV